MKRILCILFLLTSFTLVQLSARDFYVRQGAEGTGAKESPYGELWRALEQALRGDVIHVAGGVYTGKGGSGSFIVRVPKLTIAGGYSEDFSVRDPFMYKTMLQRATDYKGDMLGLPQGILEGKDGADHSGLVVDGLVLNGKTRNAYYPSGDLSVRGSWDGVLFATSSPDIIVRNTVFINPYGGGIYSRWYGENNEVSNCFFINNFYCAVDTRSAQPESVITIKNNTIAFIWEQPGKGGGMGINVGSQGETKIENNIIMFTEEFAVYNSLKNTDTVMRNNVFFQNRGGIYKYLEREGRNLLVWKPNELEDLNQNAETYSLWESGGNTIKNPNPKPDKDYFSGFANKMMASLGLFDIDAMKAVWTAAGLSGAPSSSQKQNWGHAYPVENLSGMDLASDAGAHRQKTYLAYSSADSASPAASYTKVEFSLFSRETPEVKKLDNTAVEFSAAMGANQIVYFEHIVAKTDYRCVMLNMPGEKSYTRNYVYGYLLKGSAAEKVWDKYYAKRDRYYEKGLSIKGRAYYVKNDSYLFPVGVIIDEITLP
ncbi:MAG: right-handed parallel beta-helix repeat-containing protein [Spirochaetales bacterium]|nr:right-handed parallel beta-helix repeat-containing protein [Spirochaetales bacterium]